MKRLIVIGFLLLLSCNKKQTVHNRFEQQVDTVSTSYAKGFSILNYKNFQLLKIQSFKDSVHTLYTYLLAKPHAKVPRSIKYDYKLQIPIQTLVATSTTHIPPLVALGEEKSLVGFPHLDYISSPEIRERISQHKITELGENENINFELLLSLQPDLLMGFSIDQHSGYKNISQVGIPILYNMDWREESPLGKAEWIKVYGALFDKTERAEHIFKKIETDYQSAKELVPDGIKRPEVLSGALYRDVWYVPGGESWSARLIDDAGGAYVYENLKNTESVALSFESVFNTAKDADIWINPSYFSDLEEMKNKSKHYLQFKAFQKKHIYNYTSKKGATGGMLYFEYGPSRPDLILKDLIHIFHPELLPKNYKPSFYQALK